LSRLVSGDSDEALPTTVLVSLVTGRRDHYYAAKELADRDCKRMFLMQRSSTLILGPELGWTAEAAFYDALLGSIDRGSEFYHVVSLEGIARHLLRRQSVFPRIEVALEQLVCDEQGSVHVRAPDRTWPLKVVTEGDDVDMKPDRQARVFVVELTDGTAEGVLVLDLGGSQSCFQLRGPDMKTYLQCCIEFYAGCTALRWSALGTVLADGPVTITATGDRSCNGRRGSSRCVRKASQRIQMTQSIQTEGDLAWH